MLIKAITHHSKCSQTRSPHCGSSRRVCMKGVHSHKAGTAHWKQPPRRFSTSHRSRWGIFLSFLAALIARSAWTELKHGNWCDHQVCSVCGYSHHVQMFCSLESWKQTALLLGGKMEESVERGQTRYPLPNTTAAFLVSAGLQFASGPTWPITSLIQETEDFTWSINFSGLMLLLFTRRQTSHT